MDSIEAWMTLGPKRYFGIPLGQKSIETDRRTHRRAVCKGDAVSLHHSEPGIRTIYRLMLLSQEPFRREFPGSCNETGMSGGRFYGLRVRYSMGHIFCRISSRTVCIKSLLSVQAQHHGRIELAPRMDLDGQDRTRSSYPCSFIKPSGRSMIFSIITETACPVVLQGKMRYRSHEAVSSLPGIAVRPRVVGLDLLHAGDCVPFMCGVSRVAVPHARDLGFRSACNASCPIIS